MLIEVQVYQMPAPGLWPKEPPPTQPMLIQTEDVRQVSLITKTDWPIVLGVKTLDGYYLCAGRLQQFLEAKQADPGEQGLQLKPNPNRLSRSEDIQPPPSLLVDQTPPLKRAPLPERPACFFQHDVGRVVDELICQHSDGYSRHRKIRFVDAVIGELGNWMCEERRKLGPDPEE